MRRKLGALVALILVTLGLTMGHVPQANANHWSQNYHWLRTQQYTGSTSTTETTVYWAARYGLSAQTKPIVDWAAGYYNGHAELKVIVVDQCPAGRNCILWKNGPVNGGLTSVGVGNGHMYGQGATVTLAYDIGSAATGQYLSRIIAFHEACHAYGGGLNNETYHYQCNWDHRSHTFAEITRVYHDDPG